MKPNKTKARAKIEIKAIDKALVKTIGEFNPEFNFSCRHAFVVMSVNEDDNGLSLALHKVDKETMQIGDPIEAFVEGGATGFIATAVHGLLAGELEEIGNKAIMAGKFTDMMDELFERKES